MVKRGHTPSGENAESNTLPAFQLVHRPKLSQIAIGAPNQADSGLAPASFHFRNTLRPDALGAGL